MRPESPTPFPHPEIIRDPEHPPILMDLEIHPPALADLMAQVSDGRIARLRRITIRGGLVPALTAADGVGATHPMLVLKNISEHPTPQTLLDTVYTFHLGWALGGYSAARKEISIHPDTILLNAIIDLAANASQRPSGHKPEAEVNNIHLNLLSVSAETLTEEVEHCFQKHAILAHFYPPLWRKHEEEARRKRMNPGLSLLAMRALTVQMLIPDKKLLELYDIARDRYRAFKGVFP